MTKNILILSNRYNKQEFGRKWSQITSKLSRHLTSEDLDFIRETLKLTSSYYRMAADKSTKFRVGTASFQRYPVRGLILISPNSQKEIWIGKDALIKLLFPSKKKTIGHSNRTPRSLLSAAFRQAVEMQVQEFRNQTRLMMYSENTMICPLSFVKLTECEEGTEVDHVYPFSRMVNDFLWQEKLNSEYFQVIKRGTSIFFKDKQLRDRWVAYHLKNAKLQLVCKKANRKKSNKF